MVVGCAFSSFLRGLLLWGLIVIGGALAVAIVYCLTTRAKRSNWSSLTPQTPSSRRPNVRGTVPVVTSNPSTTTAATDRDVKSLDWFQFEKLVAAAYEQQGYSVDRSGGANPDGGIDLTLTKAGTTFAVQCKHWKTWKVGVKQIREFLGALTDCGIQNGVFVTLHGYTGEGKELAARHRIQLIDERALLQLLEAVNWKRNPTITSILNDTRKICPRCESEMVLRAARKGSTAGHQFWGCSTYPSCRSTMQQA